MQISGQGIDGGEEGWVAWGSGLVRDRNQNEGFLSEKWPILVRTHSDKYTPGQPWQSGKGNVKGNEQRAPGRNRQWSVGAAARVRTSRLTLFLVFDAGQTSSIIILILVLVGDVFLLPIVIIPIIIMISGASEEYSWGLFWSSLSWFGGGEIDPIIIILMISEASVELCLGHFLPPVSSSLSQDLSASHTTYNIVIIIINIININWSTACLYANASQLIWLPLFVTMRDTTKLQNLADITVLLPSGFLAQTDNGAGGIEGLTVLKYRCCHFLKLA